MLYIISVGVNYYNILARILLYIVHPSICIMRSAVTIMLCHQNLTGIQNVNIIRLFIEKFHCPSTDELAITIIVFPLEFNKYAKFQQSSLTNSLHSIIYGYNELTGSSWAEISWGTWVAWEAQRSLACGSAPRCGFDGHACHVLLSQPEIFMKLLVYFRIKCLFSSQD